MRRGNAHARHLLAKLDSQVFAYASYASQPHPLASAFPEPSYLMKSMKTPIVFHALLSSTKQKESYRVARGKNAATCLCLLPAATVFLHGEQQHLCMRPLQRWLCVAGTYLHNPKKQKLDISARVPMVFKGAEAEAGGRSRQGIADDAPTPSKLIPHEPMRPCAHWQAKPRVSSGSHTHQATRFID